MKLHDYQVRMADHIVDHPRSGLFVDMGMGKTAATLHALVDLPKPVLVVAPKRVTRTVWQQEAEKWGIPLTFSLVMGTPAERDAALGYEADVYLINVDNFVWLRNKGVWPYPTLVLDESSLFKTSGSKRSRAALWASTRAEHVIILTGTPAPNGLEDLFHQIKILDGGKRLGRNKRQFLQTYFYPENPYFEHTKWLIRPGEEQTLRNKISDICLSLQAQDYLSLPDRIINDIPVVLNNTLMDQYDELCREMYLQMEKGDIDAASAGVLVAKLQQFASGAVYTDDDWTVLHEAKLQALDDIIEEAAGQPILIWYQYRHSLSRIQARYNKRLIISSIKDSGSIDLWNEGKTDLLLAHPASGGHGLNLQHGGHIMVWFDVPWNLEHYEQANARLHRQGQDQPVMIHRLLAQDTIDTEIVDALANKQAVQVTLMRGLKRGEM